MNENHMGPIYFQTEFAVNDWEIQQLDGRRHIMSVLGSDILSKVIS